MSAHEDHDDHHDDEHEDDHHHGPAFDGEGDAPDATLGGYFALHKRPPAFEGIDGQPYSVSVETEKGPDLRKPWAAYLVFPQWAETGVGIVGHVETPILWEGRAREEVEALAGETPLIEVQRLLNEAIRRRASENE